MSLEAMIRAADLEGALELAISKARDDPANSKHRILLFQLFILTGEWERALNQLNVLGEMDSGVLALVNTYRELIRCETERRAVFAGKIPPVIFGQPEEWMALMVESLRLLNQGMQAQADEARARAFEAAPTSQGSVDGEPFDWIADADSRLGPLLEAVVNGKYYWVPFHRLRSVSLEPPEDLRDMVWMPALFSWQNEGEAYGFIPSRYATTEALGDNQDRLARKTEWDVIGEQAYSGIGQRLLVTDQGDKPLLNIRDLQFSSSAQ